MGTTAHRLQKQITGKRADEVVDAGGRLLAVRQEAGIVSAPRTADQPCP